MISNSIERLVFDLTDSGGVKDDSDSVEGENARNRGTGSQFGGREVKNR